MLHRSLCAAGALSTLGAIAPPLSAMQQDSSATGRPVGLEVRALIEPDSLDRATFSNLAELLQARIPGLSVTRRGDGGTVVRLRGPSSLYADNAPLLIVDDVRISLSRSRIEEFDGRPSPLDDIDVEQVARVELVPASTAAVLYGTGAANGVIKVSTRGAIATPTHWRIFAAAGGVAEPKSYPASFERPGITPSGQPITCTLVREANGTCTPTGPVSSFNLLEEEQVAGLASLGRLGASVSSGSESLSGYAGATFEKEGSVIDAFARQRVYARAMARAQLSSAAELSFRAHWMDGTTPLIVPIFPALRWQGLIAFGPRASWPELLRLPEPERDISRRGLSILATWRARGWLSGTVLSGLEYSTGTDSYVRTSSFNGTTTSYGEYVRQRRHDFTGRADVQASYTIGSHLRARTTALVDLVEERRRDVYADGAWTPDGLSASTFMQLGHDQDIAGLAMEQEISASDRAIVRFGLRHEDVDLWGGYGWKTPWYPHASFAWLASKDDAGLLGPIRFRAAYGKTGKIPSTEHLLFAVFQPVTPLEPGREPLERKAEVTTEREAGIDATLFGRVDGSVSWYSRRTTDVLMQSPAPPSMGFLGEIPSFGEIINRGVEIGIRTKVVDRPRLGWNVRIIYAHNHNELSKSESPPTLFASQQWYSEGVPVAAYGRRAVVSAVDADGDGVLDSSCLAPQPQPCEVQFGDVTYHPAFPPTEASLESAFRLGLVTLTVLVDHRRGHFLHNLTEASRCNFGRCADAYATSLAQETAIRQASVAGGNYLASGAFIENATFTKLRELALRLQAPAAWARGLGGHKLELSLAARNVATWTDYSGIDPEASAYGDNTLIVGDRASAPLPRSLSLRVSLTK
jgi:outer membrane receptor protein involved in Fe transport